MYVRKKNNELLPNSLLEFIGMAMFISGKATGITHICVDYI